MFGLKKPVVLFDTAIDTNNLGDNIIMKYAEQVLREIMGSEKLVRVPTHRPPNSREIKHIKRGSLHIICGTNILCPNVAVYDQWQRPSDPSTLRNIILLSVGLQDDRGLQLPSVEWYGRILSKKNMHSVRDSRTAQELRNAGISNVRNTGCVTMWGLTPEKCAAIPKAKARNAIVTLTHYRNGSFNAELLSTVRRNYDTVYFWPQGDKDLEFLQSLGDIRDYRLVPRTLEAFEEILLGGGVDYIGTRLHGGIHAMNLGVRSLIVEVDTRSSDIAKDTNLPVINPANIFQLEDRIRASWETQLNIPEQAILDWKRQFSRGK